MPENDLQNILNHHMKGQYVWLLRCYRIEELKKEWLTIAWSNFHICSPENFFLHSPYWNEWEFKKGILEPMTPFVRLPRLTFLAIVLGAPCVKRQLGRAECKMVIYRIHILLVFILANHTQMEPLAQGVQTRRARCKSCHRTISIARITFSLPPLDTPKNFHQKWPVKECMIYELDWSCSFPIADHASGANQCASVFTSTLRWSSNKSDCTICHICYFCYHL